MRKSKITPEVINLIKEYHSKGLGVKNISKLLPIKISPIAVWHIIKFGRVLSPRGYRIYKKRVCPECYGQIINADGELVCEVCGLVIEEGEKLERDVFLEISQNQPTSKLNYLSLGDTLRKEDLEKVIGVKDCEIIKKIDEAPKHLKTLLKMMRDRLKKLGYSKDFYLSEVCGTLVRHFLDKLNEELKSLPEGFLNSNVIKFQHGPICDAILSLILNHYNLNKKWICKNCKKPIESDLVFYSGEAIHKYCLSSKKLMLMIDAISLVNHFAIPKALEKILSEKLK